MMQILIRRYTSAKALQAAGVLAAVLATGACQKQMPSSAEAVSPKATTPAAALPKIVDSKLDQIQSLDSTQLARFDRDEVENIKQGMACSIDSVNTLAPGASPLKSGSDLRISGWISQGSAPANRVLAILKGEQAYAVVAQVRGDRPDIAQKANVPGAVDVVAQTINAKVPTGTYKVYFARKDDAGWAKCVANAEVLFE